MSHKPPRKLHRNETFPDVHNMPIPDGGSLAGSPCSVEPVSRQVIEHKLLTALEDGGVAALLSEQDLEALIIACRSYPKPRDNTGIRLDGLRLGMEQLLREAFPPNSN